MGLSYGFKINWQKFWDSQENNPNCELSFLYKGNYYILLHEDYKWSINYFIYDPATLEGYAANEEIISVSEKKYGHRNYHDDENWNDSINACYTLLTKPFIDGKSFKDIIEDIDFEY